MLPCIISNSQPFTIKNIVSPISPIYAYKSLCVQEPYFTNLALVWALFINYSNICKLTNETFKDFPTVFNELDIITIIINIIVNIIFNIIIHPGSNH